MDYRPESDIIYPSSGATGASWRLSDDQTECLNSSEKDTSQLVKTDKLTGSRWHHWHWHCAACGGGAGTASLLVRWIISILNTTQQFSEISYFHENHFRHHSLWNKDIFEMTDNKDVINDHNDVDDHGQCWWIWWRSWSWWWKQCDPNPTCIQCGTVFQSKIAVVEHQSEVHNIKPCR